MLEDPGVDGVNFNINTQNMDGVCVVESSRTECSRGTISKPAWLELRRSDLPYECAVGVTALLTSNTYYT
jgi:hypothetical protein